MVKWVHFMVFGYLYLAQMDTNPSNLGFSIPFNLYIHDHDLEEASGTLTCGLFMYVFLIWPNGYILWYSVTFVWLRRIPIYKITSSLGFSITFHLYIHDCDLEQVSGTPTCGARSCTCLRYGQMGTFYGIRLPSFGSDGYQSIKLLQISGLAFLSTSPFMIVTQNKCQVHLRVGRSCTYTLYAHFMVFGCLYLAKTNTIPSNYFKSCF